MPEPLSATDEVKRAPSPPPSVLRLAVAGLALALVGVAAMAWGAYDLWTYNNKGWISATIAVVLVVGSVIPTYPAVRAFGLNAKRSARLAEDDLVGARRIAADGKESAQQALGYAAAVLIVAGCLILTFLNDGGIARTYFSPQAFRDNPELTAEMPRLFFGSLWINVWVSIASMIFVLLFGLLLAVMRMLPGRAGAPLRLIATVYTDVFRGIPAIVTLFIVAFGLSTTGLPLVGSLPTPVYGVIGLTMTYSAYVAEVYRAGIDSIHPSQSAAARSLGLSYGMTLRTVVIPQAVRRVVPPLLNAFISIQKDTALLSVIAVMEVFNQMGQIQSQYFTFFPVIIAALAFVALTIPQARLSDYLLERARKKQAGSA